MNGYYNVLSPGLRVWIRTDLAVRPHGERVLVLGAIEVALAYVCSYGGMAWYLRGLKLPDYSRVLDTSCIRCIRSC